MTQARLPYSRRSGPGFGLALALFLCAGMPALAQTGGEAVRDGPVPVTADPGPPSARDVLNAELARMRAERAELARFIAWQEKLVRAAKSDPAAALAQRLPMSECRASVLEPICHRLVALFAPHETGAGTSEDETGAAGTSSGPPLNTGEKEALRLRVSSCWNVAALPSDAVNTVVVVGFSLNRDGTVAGDSVRLLDSSGGTESAVRQAFEAARRAILRCGGYDLPAEKYDQWRDLEIVFNPERMRVK